jgi:snapalysin
MASRNTRPAKRLAALAAGFGLACTALGGAATVASAQPATPDASTPATPYASFTPQAGSTDAADAKAFFEAVLASVAKKQAAHPDLKSVTVTYDPSGAPTYASQIATSTQIWNSSVSNVQLAAGGSNSDFAYYEGNDPNGSYASTDGHGRGYVFIDYAQSQEYDQVRIVAHETGHILGLPDDYSGPCSELMSGGGPGPSCTNRYPDADERAEVDQLWANGLTKALHKLHQVH